MLQVPPRIVESAQAVATLQKARELHPDLAEPYNNLGVVYSAQRKTAAARPSYPEAWNNMGTAFARQGNLRDAARCFEEALRLRPDFDDARRNLERVRASRSQQ